MPVPWIFCITFFLHSWHKVDCCSCIQDRRKLGVLGGGNETWLTGVCTTCLHIRQQPPIAYRASKDRYCKWECSILLVLIGRRGTCLIKWPCTCITTCRSPSDFQTFLRPCIETWEDETFDSRDKSSDSKLSFFESPPFFPSFLCILSLVPVEMGDRGESQEDTESQGEVRGARSQRARRQEARWRWGG